MNTELAGARVRDPVTAKCGLAATREQTGDLAARGATRPRFRRRDQGASSGTFAIAAAVATPYDCGMMGASD